MAVTSPASLSKIIAEFGGPNNLAAYVRGGAYVPNTSANSAISTTASGLAISQFVGASKDNPATVNLIDLFVSDSRPQGAAITAYAECQLQNNGQIWTSNSQFPSQLRGSWLTGGSASDYEIYASVMAGLPSYGVVNQWLNLGTTRSWGVESTGPTKTSMLSLQIRRIGTTTILDTSTLNLSASVGEMEV